MGDAEAGDPGERRRYRTLDVTRHLLPGANRLGVLLGDGAYGFDGLTGPSDSDTLRLYAIAKPEDEAVQNDCLGRVAALCDRFPLYPYLQIPVPAKISG